MGDITNPQSRGLNGGSLSQSELRRLSQSHKPLVDAMLVEVCNRLLGHSPKMPRKDDMLVWINAASFLGERVQVPDTPSGDMPSDHRDRAPDMTALAGAHLRSTVARMEAALKLMYNQQNVAMDLTNPGPQNIEGKTLTQTELKRVDRKDLATVDKMLTALGGRLQGQDVSGPSTPEEGMVWAQAATYLSSRTQGTSGACPGRAPDMSRNAATMMLRMLAQIEACGKLMSNRERVVKDITNPGPQNIDGKQLTQAALKRVNPTHQETVLAMVHEVCGCLLGKKMSIPPTPGVAQVWTDAASYFHGRIQALASECRGRNPDMSPAAAEAMRKVLAQIINRPAKIDTLSSLILTHLAEEKAGVSQLMVDASTQYFSSFLPQPEKIAASSWEAAQKLMSNRGRIVQDIANPGPNNIDGKALTQMQLKRVNSKDRAAVDAMIIEVCCRLLGKTITSPSQQDAQVWAAAAAYLSDRIQGTPEQMPGRKPDMSQDAATALRAVLQPIIRTN